MKLSFYLAYKNLVNHKKLFFLLTIILVFSFVNLTFFNAITDGARITTNEQLRTYVFSDLRILPKSDEKFITNTNEVINKVVRIKGVNSVTQRLTIDGSIDDGDNTFLIPITGIQPETEIYVTNFDTAIKKGNYLSNLDNHAIIGDEVVGNLDGRKSTMDYEALDLDVGSDFKIYYSNGESRDYKVSGIFDTYFWISDFKIFVPIDEVREIYGFDKETSSEILIKLDENVNKNEIKNEMINNGIDLRIVNSIDDLGLADTILESQEITTYLANIIGIFCTFITVFIVIFIIVNNNKKQLGILKAIGIDYKTIINSYIILSFFYAIFGVIFGILTLEGICLYLKYNQIMLPVGYFYPVATTFQILKGSFILIFASIISGYLGSYKIVKRNIVSVIRGD